MNLNAHLMFNGQCKAAFEYYERCFGGKIITMITWGESPMKDRAPEGARDMILHASLKVGDSFLLGADVAPKDYQQPQGFYIALGIDDVAEAERIFDALAKNGTVQMPLQQTFWAIRFGMVVDQFGVPWEINCENASPDES